MSGSQAAVFTQGSTMGHVARMTVTGSIGLMAIFVVEFLTLLYVSWLKDDALTAAVGYASVILFMLISTNIGFMIAATALTARRLGAKDVEGARRIAASSLFWMVASALILTLLLLPALKPVLGLLGARDRVADVAHGFLLIALPSHVLMALGMGFSAALRAVGDANRAMYVTLAGGLVTAVIDPILIFTLGLGIDGAAICVVISRLVFMAVGWHGAVRVHAMVARPRLAHALGDLKRVADIAVPAILTNLATPVSLAFVARIVSDFGPWAVAANAVIDRLTPLAFGALFALSAAVGPILAQNWGAGMYHRMRQGLRDSFLFVGIYVLATWILLVALRHQIVALFALSGPAAEGLMFFCWISGPMWFFIGLLFTANAAFNNLGFPFYATVFNWGRGLVGTALAAWIGAEAGGYAGALTGMMIGQVGFGVAAATAAVLCIRRLERDALTAGRSGESPPPDGARDARPRWRLD